MRRPLRSDEARSVANLAIDLGDPGRMAKARRIHRGNNVGSVDIGGGKAEATVVGLDGDSQEVTITVEADIAPGQAPSAADVSSACTCDDGGDICTHGLATILGIAEEIEANGRLLTVWSGGAAEEEQQPVEVARDVSDNDFFNGRWTSPPAIQQMSGLKFGEEPHLVVDDIDAGPVLVDARAAIKRGLSRYRVR